MTSELLSGMMAFLQIKKEYAYAFTPALPGLQQERRRAVTRREYATPRVLLLQGRRIEEPNWFRLIANPEIGNVYSDEDVM
jgi:hypothetical protein